MKIFENIKIKYIIITSFVSTFVVVGLIITYYNSIPKEEPLIGAYNNGTYSETLPTKGSGYKVEKIVCDNNKNASWDNDKWGIKLSNWSTRSRCNIYFVDAEKINIGNVAVPLDAYDLCPTVNADGSATVTEAESTYGYLCSMKDAYGTSYYYRGNVTNNYVKFAEFYWRIIRINGDGTVRVIYDGTSAHANGEPSKDRQVEFVVSFNRDPGDNAYVGYMYGKTGASTYAETHANTNNSEIRNLLDDWYEGFVKGKTNEQYVKDNIFCNDRSFAPNNSGTGTGTSTTYYRWYNFADSPNNNKMMLICPQKNDAFTVNDTSKGNGALTYGIGLVTSDEVVLAGGWNISNKGYYLYSGAPYWTMSPYFFSDSYAYEHYVFSDGYAGGDSHAYYYDHVGYSKGARPVLNLSSEILKNGDGTMDNPFHP